MTAEQMREVDRIMIEDLHIELAQMMENAGRNLAELALRRFRPETVTVLAGRGGNGGGGLVAAWNLANRGATVHVAPAGGPQELGPVPAHKLVARPGAQRVRQAAVLAAAGPAEVAGFLALVAAAIAAGYGWQLRP